jgi:hypothetical protein
MFCELKFQINLRDANIFMLYKRKHTNFPLKKQYIIKKTGRKINCHKTVEEIWNWEIRSE